MESDSTQKLQDLSSAPAGPHEGRDPSLPQQLAEPDLLGSITLGGMYITDANNGSDLPLSQHSQEKDQRATHRYQ